MKLFIFLTFLLLSCTPKTKESDEKVTINEIEIKKSILDELEEATGKKIEPLKTEIWVRVPDNELDFKPVDSIMKGIQIPFVEDKIARALVRKSLDKVKAEGYYIYLRNLDFDKEFVNSYYDIAIVKVADQFELIKFAQTDGVNYNVSNDMIVEKLKKWNEESPFVIITADMDRIEADFIQLPKDMTAFARDMYEFCPDVIDQGAESEEELINYFKTEKGFWLWWD